MIGLGVKTKIKRPVSNAETQITSRISDLFGLIRRKSGQVKDRLLIPRGETERSERGM